MRIDNFPHRTNGRGHCGDTADEAGVEPGTGEGEATTPETATEPTIPTTDEEPTPKKSKKLKLKADLKPKKLSMIKVLQERKVAMTCPELIDVMATEGLWTSPGGKTPAATLYAAISRSIKDLGRSSPFKKTKRGKFEAKVRSKE